jgi:hypothetical protein
MAESDPIETLTRLHAASTQGEWYAYFTTHGDPFVVGDPERWLFTRIADIATAPNDYGKANAEFIAAAHNLMPKVAERVRELEAEVEQQKERADSNFQSYLRVRDCNSENANEVARLKGELEEFHRLARNAMGISQEADTEGEKE